MVERTQTFSAVTTLWGGRHGCLILMLVLLRRELKLKRLAKISMTTVSKLSPARNFFGAFM